MSIINSSFSFLSKFANEKLKKDNIQKENDANIAHYTVGKNIREVISKNRETMPEDLPTPKISLKQLEKERQTNLIR